MGSDYSQETPGTGDKVVVLDCTDSGGWSDCSPKFEGEFNYSPTSKL